MIALVIRFRTGRWYGRWYGNTHLRVRLFLVLVVGYPFRWQSPKGATKEFLSLVPFHILFSGQTRVVLSVFLRDLRSTNRPPSVTSEQMGGPKGTTH